jgi:hypothetical protein
MATTKKKTVTEEVVVDETVIGAEETPAVTETKPAKAQKPVKTARKFAPDDLVLCRSIFPGTFLFTGAKTKVIYTFEAKGDECYVEYQDLLSAMLTKKRALTAPYILIEDEEVLESAHWQEIKKLYDKLNTLGDVNKLIAMPYVEFKKRFEQLPIGAKKNVMLTVSSLIRDGEFDSMNKIELIDKACNSNLAVLLKR